MTQKLIEFKSTKLYKLRGVKMTKTTNLHELIVEHKKLSEIFTLLVEDLGHIFLLNIIQLV